MRAKARKHGAAAAMPAASQPVTPWPVSGLASGMQSNLHTGRDAFPCQPCRAIAQWRMSRLDSLTVAGAVPE